MLGLARSSGSWPRSIGLAFCTRGLHCFLTVRFPGEAKHFQQQVGGRVCGGLAGRLTAEAAERGQQARCSIFVAPVEEVFILPPARPPFPTAPTVPLGTAEPDGCNRCPLLVRYSQQEPRESERERGMAHVAAAAEVRLEYTSISGAWVLDLARLVAVS